MSKNSQTPTKDREQFSVISLQASVVSLQSSDISRQVLALKVLYPFWFIVYDPHQGENKMRNNHILSFLSVSKSMRLSVLFVCLWVFSSAFAESPTPMPTPTPTPHPMPTLGPTPLPNRTASGFDITRCTKCHNESPGRIFRQFPRLAGQKVNYFISSMKAYEDGHRTSPDAKRLMTKRFDKWKLNETTTKELAE